MTTRKSLGKRARFAIFDRDKFTCHYCGKQPPEAVLVIDHIVAVSLGGTNEEANLITSCEACNQGKSDIPLGSFAPTEQTSARIAQEYIEQKRLAELCDEAAKARSAASQSICNYWCQAFGLKACEKRYLTILLTLCKEFGPDRVFGWIDQTAAKGLWGDKDESIKYMRGIARFTREREETP